MPAVGFRDRSALALAFLAAVSTCGSEFIIADEGDAMAQTMVQLHPKDSHPNIRRERSSNSHLVAGAV